MKTETVIEGALLGLFMTSACLFTAVLEHPASPVRHAVSNGLARRGMMGLLMGATAVFLIYSPWGKRSGAHMNPAVTLTFWRLGKIKTRQALAYITAQFTGGLVAVFSLSVLFPWLSNPAVSFAATRPGSHGVIAAWWGEFVIAFLLMSVVLMAMNSRFKQWTGVIAGLLVSLYITFEAPISGMSMNPARTLASAWPAGVWNSIWIYFTAPVLAMLSAATLFKALEPMNFCAKLIHDTNYRCLFCEGRPS